jgi:hypothetical protein
MIRSKRVQGIVSAGVIAVGISACGAAHNSAAPQSAQAALTGNCTIVNTGNGNIPGFAIDINNTENTPVAVSAVNIIGYVGDLETGSTSVDIGQIFAGNQSLEFQPSLPNGWYTEKYLPATYAGEGYTTVYTSTPNTCQILSFDS